MSYRTPDHPLAGLCQARGPGARRSYDSDSTTPDLVIALIAARGADHALGCHARHHSGKKLSHGDIRLLGELLQLLEARRRILAAHREATESESLRDRIIELDDQLTLLDDRREEIVLATREADSPSARAELAAARLADQLCWHHEHIAGRPRLSRRPRLLHRIILALEDLQAEISHDDSAAFHITRLVIEDRLPLLRRELGDIELAHQTASDEAHIASLTTATRDEQIEYDLHFAERDRSSRDLDSLGHLCDRLFEIEIQLLDLLQRGDSSRQAHVIEVISTVQDDLALYEGEYARIHTLQSTSRLPEE